MLLNTITLITISFIISYCSNTNSQSCEKKIWTTGTLYCGYKHPQRDKIDLHFPDKMGNCGKH